MNDDQTYNIIRKGKTILLTTANSHIKILQDTISADILNLELTILYRNKICDAQKIQLIHQMFNHLSSDIDLLITSHKQEALASVNNLMKNFAKSISLENISKMTKNDNVEKIQKTRNNKLEH